MSKVLVAEDDPALLASYQEAITAFGHECIAARDGREALELARRHRPDVVVTDYMMPIMSGIEVIRALRLDPALSQVPTVLLSAARPPDHERSEAAMFVSKPLTLERLEATIREALELAKMKES